MSLTKRATGMPTNQVPPTRAALRKQLAERMTRLLGAYWCKRDKKFIAKIKSNGVNRVIGYFNTAELAHSAYIDAKRHIHPFSTI